MTDDILTADERALVDNPMGMPLRPIIDRLERRVLAGDVAVEILTKGLAECEVRVMKAEARYRPESIAEREVAAQMDAMHPEDIEYDVTLPRIPMGPKVERRVGDEPWKIPCKLCGEVPIRDILTEALSCCSCRHLVVKWTRLGA